MSNLSRWFARHWLSLAQVLGLLVFLYGFLKVAGLDWTLLVAGAVAVVVAVLAEYSAPRQGWRDGS